MAKGVSRDRRREAQWRGVIRAHRDSGLTIREFCRKRKLPESAFYFWRGELQRRQAEPEQRRPADPPAFVPVRVEDASACAGAPARAAGRIEIELPGGGRVHVIAPVDRQALADVLLAVSEAERALLLAAPSAVEGEAHQC